MADGTLVMTDTQQAALTFKVEDAKGNPAKVEGSPEWNSSDTTKVTVSPSADGQSATIKAVGPLTETNVQISVTADADLGTGSKPIVGLLDVQIVAGEAVTVAISAGTPEEQTT